MVKPTNTKVTARDKAADHYVDVTLCGRPIEEQQCWDGFAAGWDEALSDRNIQFLVEPLSIWARKAFYERLATLKEGGTNGT